MEDQFQEQREKLWRRTGSGAEPATGRGHPELELEARLTEALAQLPEAPVSSNFTARVLAAIDREDARAAQPRHWQWNWHGLWPRLAAATALLLFVGLGFRQHQVSQRRAEMVRTLTVVASATAPVPSVDALENLDAIQRIGQSSRADTDLLAALQ